MSKPAGRGKRVFPIRWFCILATAGGNSSGFGRSFGLKFSSNPLNQAKAVKTSVNTITSSICHNPAVYFGLARLELICRYSEQCAGSSMSFSRKCDQLQSIRELGPLADSLFALWIKFDLTVISLVFQLVSGRSFPSCWSSCDHISHLYDPSHRSKMSLHFWHLQGTFFSEDGDLPPIHDDSPGSRSPEVPTRS